MHIKLHYPKLFHIVSAYETEVKFNVPDTIYNETAVNGNCTVVYTNTKHRPLPCGMMRIRVKPNSPNKDACKVSQPIKGDWLATGCIADFTILCSKSNVSIDLQCAHSNANLIKKINGKHYSINKSVVI